LSCALIEGKFMSLLRSVCVALSACGLAAGASAQTTYPAKPVRLVVPYPPGASNDVLSRITAQAMIPGLGQQIVVDNRAGAGGMIGAEHVARADADGYTILNVQSSFTTNAAVRPKLPYDPQKDFAYIGMMALGPMLLVVHPSLPAKSAGDVVRIAKARPGQLNYGSSGNGGINHMSTELFARMAKIDIVHVPYKGIAPAVTDLIAGNTQLVITSLPSAMAQLKSGRLKALGVGGAKRSTLAPELPTISESGVPGYVAELWWGLAAPAKTPSAVLDRLSAELTRSLRSSDVKERYAREGGEPVIMTRAEFTEFVRQEIERWRKVAREANIQPEG
jgi:tripartite-type tricarboxylate transporter receptor subunit TctC